MVTEKRDIGYALKLDIEEINRDRIRADYALDNENNYVDLLEGIGNYLTQLDSEYLYSGDSTWVKFFRANIANWFGDDYAFVVIDDGYWLLSFAATIEGVQNWDMSRINLDDLESARKLVKLLNVVEGIGDSTNRKDGT
jgi:hypothetical protein